MKVTVCQLGNSPQDLEREWSGLAGHVRENRSDLVLLPEMPFSPWFAAAGKVDPRVWESAVAAHESWLNRLPELGAATVVGTRPVNRGGKRVNEAFLWTAGGGVEPIHQKYYLPDEEGFWEATWYDRGDGRFETAQAAGVKLGVLICTEMWFMDRARAYGQEGVHLLLVPRATPRGSVDKWLAGGRAAAVVSGAFCLSSNRADPSGRADLGGLSWVADPEGEILGVTTAERPWITVEVDLTFAEQSKKTYPRYVKD